jgi:hypothetical protein
VDKPAWIERILSDTQAYQSLSDYITQEEDMLLEQMRDSLASNDLDKARVFAGESFAWKKLRQQIRMYEREEEQHGIIQEGR